MVRTKEQIVYDLLFKQVITPEEAEVLIQEPQWKHDPNTWLVPNDYAYPSQPLQPPTFDTNGLWHYYFDHERQTWIANN